MRTKKLRDCGIGKVDTELIQEAGIRHLHGYGLTPWVVSVGTCGYGYGYGCPYQWLYPYPHHGFPITSRGMKALIYIITTSAN